MGAGSPATSPWIWQAGDYRGSVIRITITFNNATRALTSGTLFRDSACLYRKIYIGLGADGTPDTTPRTFNVPAGTSTVTGAQMASVGLNTIEDVLSFQITAGP